MRDVDIDSMSADGAQDTARWADAVAAVAEAMAILESAKHEAALVGGTDRRAARERWNSLVSASAD